MAKVVSAVREELSRRELPAPLTEAAELLRSLVHADAYVGEVYSLGYEQALVQIHDFQRRQVGGIPALSFLVATRITQTRLFGGIAPSRGEIDLILFPS